MASLDFVSARFPLKNRKNPLTGQKTERPHDSLFWRLGEQMAIRHGDWKLVKYDHAADDGTRSGANSRIRVTKERLYNLATDIAEAHDQSEVNPQKAADLLALWQAWNAEQARPLW